MSKNGLKLIIKHFDSLENSILAAEYIETEEIFIDDTDVSAHTKCRQHLATLKFKPYLGWNNEVYPKFIIQKIFLK